MNSDRFNKVLEQYNKYDKEYNDAFEKLETSLEICDFDKVSEYAQQCKHLKGYKMLLKFKLEILDKERAKQISY